MRNINPRLFLLAENSFIHFIGRGCSQAVTYGTSMYWYGTGRPTLEQENCYPSPNAKPNPNSNPSFNLLVSVLIQAQNLTQTRNPNCEQ